MHEGYAVRAEPAAKRFTDDAVDGADFLLRVGREAFGADERVVQDA